MQQLPKRLHMLDISRGLASLAVVLWHWQHFISISSYPNIEQIQTLQPLYNYFIILYKKGWMGVDYFFLLSGFIFFWLYREDIKNKKINFKSFAIMRIARLYPLFLVTLIIVAILQYIYWK